MSATINGNAVSIGSEESFTNFLQVAPTHIEDRYDATFSRDIEPAKDGIKRKNVRVGADRQRRGCFLTFQIENYQPCIFFARYESQPMLWVNQQTVTALA